MSQKCVWWQMRDPYFLCWQVWCSTLQAHSQMTSSNLGQDIGYCDILKDLTALILTMTMKAARSFKVRDYLPSDKMSRIKRRESSTWWCIQHNHCHENLNSHDPLACCHVLSRRNTNIISSPFCKTCICKYTVHSVMCTSYVSASFCNGNKWKQ